MLNLYCKAPLLGSLMVALSISLAPWQVALAQEVVPDPPAQNQVKLKTGWIDAITQTEIVIDDLASPLSGVTVVNQQGFAVSVSSLSIGRYVAFNRDGEKIVIHLLAEQQKRPDLPDDNASQPKRGGKKEGVRQVDGVWKN